MTPLENTNTPGTGPRQSPRPGPRPGWPRWLPWVIVAAVTLAVLGWCRALPGRYAGTINAIGIDLRRPAAHVDSRSLATLPRDLVKAPWLRDVLTEDLVFYYEDHEDRLGLRGTLARIAYEHDQRLLDKLLASALDEPAELAFWMDAKGAPRHWALVFRRNALSSMLQGIGTVAAKDTQLSLLGELRGSAFGASQPVYALKLHARRTLAFTARGDRMLVLSDPGMLFPAEGAAQSSEEAASAPQAPAARVADPAAAEVAEALLDGTARSPWRETFGAQPVASGHTIVLGPELLAQGWQSFAPSIRGLKLDVEPDGRALRTRLRLDDKSFVAPSAALWSALPSQAAACTALPIDAARVRDLANGAKVAGSSGQAAGSSGQAAASSGQAAASAAAPAASADQMDALKTLASRVGGEGAVCWYAQSQLHTPLWVVRAADNAAVAPDAAAVQAVLAAWLSPKAQVSTTAAGWRARVPARWGEAGTGDGDSPAYELALRRESGWWLFSPDAKLVDRAADTLARRFPSMADAGGAQQPLLAVEPAELSRLLRKEALAVFTPRHEHFRQAAERLLWPKLDTGAKWPAVRAVTTGSADANGWTALEWQAVAAK
jgi:uncharacterized protein YfaA (DUF2138 family)